MAWSIPDMPPSCLLQVILCQAQAGQHLPVPEREGDFFTRGLSEVTILQHQFPEVTLQQVLHPKISKELALNNRVFRYVFV